MSYQARKGLRELSLPRHPPFTCTELYFCVYLASVNYFRTFASLGGNKIFALFLRRDFVPIVKLSPFCFYFFVFSFFSLSLLNVSMPSAQFYASLISLYFNCQF